MIDFRSDKERTARYAKQTRNEMRKQTALMGGEEPASTGTAVGTSLVLLVYLVGTLLLAAAFVLASSVAVPYRKAKGIHERTGAEQSLLASLTKSWATVRRVAGRIG